MGRNGVPKHGWYMMLPETTTSDGVQASTLRPTPKQARPWNGWRLAIVCMARDDPPQTWMCLFLRPTSVPKFWARLIHNPRAVSFHHLPSKKIWSTVLKHKFPTTIYYLLLVPDLLKFGCFTTNSAFNRLPSSQGPPWKCFTVRLFQCFFHIPSGKLT